MVCSTQLFDAALFLCRILKCGDAFKQCTCIHVNISQTHMSLRTFINGATRSCFKGARIINFENFSHNCFLVISTLTVTTHID